jgi:ferredoxin
MDPSSCPDTEDEITQEAQKGLLDGENKSGLLASSERAAIRILKHPLYPWGVRRILIIFLVLIIFSGLFGPKDPHQNVATVFSWMLWWPIVAVSYLLIGRAWCGICPMGALSVVFHRRFGLNLKPPGLLNRRRVILIICVSAILSLAWLEEITHASITPLITGLIALVFTFGACACGVLFERWVWCRHLCPLGAISGAFSMSSMIEIRADQKICDDNQCVDRYCYYGTEDQPGCPLKQAPKIMASNVYCIMCGNCIKACPHDAIRIYLRPPGSEGVRQPRSKPEHAFISVVMMGIVFFQGFVLTEMWGNIYGEVFARLPGQVTNIIMNGILLLICTVLPAIMFYLAARLYAVVSKQSWTVELGCFGLAFLPLALTAHIGQNLKNFVDGFHYIPYALLSLLKIPTQPPVLALRGSISWHWFEILFVIMGCWMTLITLKNFHCVRRKMENKFFRVCFPFIVMSCVITGIFILLYIAP